MSLCSSALTTDSIISFRSNAGVTIKSIKKDPSSSKKCPKETVSNCRCKAKSEGLDITCENVNSEQLNVSNKQDSKNFSV